MIITKGKFEQIKVEEFAKGYATACMDMKVFCEECKYIPNCELAKHEEVDTCKKGEKCCEEQKDYCVRNDMSCKDCPSNMEDNVVLAVLI